MPLKTERKTRRDSLAVAEALHDMLAAIPGRPKVPFEPDPERRAAQVEKAAAKAARRRRALSRLESPTPAERVERDELDRDDRTRRRILDRWAKAGRIAERRFPSMSEAERDLERVNLLCDLLERDERRERKTRREVRRLVAIIEGRPIGKAAKAAQRVAAPVSAPRARPAPRSPVPVEQVAQAPAPRRQKIGVTYMRLEP